MFELTRYSSGRDALRRGPNALVDCVEVPAGQVHRGEYLPHPADAMKRRPQPGRAAGREPVGLKNLSLFVSCGFRSPVPPGLA